MRKFIPGAATAYIANKVWREEDPSRDRNDLKQSLRVNLSFLDVSHLDIDGHIQDGFSLGGGRQTFSPEG